MYLTNFIIAQINDFHIHGHKYKHLSTCIYIHHPTLSSSSTAAEVPYNVSVIASTSVGEGVEYLSIIFTQEGCKFELQCNIKSISYIHVHVYIFVFH